ncbi:hypothetical protein NHU_00499 [Rhodovulum sulfidophilum]|uniref:Uncharacterized protein n=1 Tax=Rhodovulum sulfidophilum TaxID=35806 RepID=A0A0D6AXP4_RHOSU|nr:hypothetical protein NHU_00499 [Rhodovulum sulfidophilum]
MPHFSSPAPARSPGNNRETASADCVETVILDEFPAWILRVALTGWIAPSPGEPRGGSGRRWREGDLV